MMKHLLIFLVITGVFIACLRGGHGWQRTRSGERFEDFQTVALQNITPVLSNYMRDAHISYTIYKIPNYVREFIKYNKDFGEIYTSGKYTIVTFTGFKRPPKNAQTLKNFYKRLNKEAYNHQGFFDYINRPEILDTHFVLKNDKMGYKDFRLYCNRFCIIDPNRDTMFVFKHITESEIKALGVVFQEYELAND